MKISMYDFLEKFCEKHISRAASDYVGGCNGPWKQNETPARVLSHYSVLFYEAHKKFENSSYRAKALELSSAIIDDWFPMQKTIWHRKGPDVDLPNGLMGQAWSLEALNAAYLLSQDRKYSDAINLITGNHKFNSAERLWHITFVDGMYGPIDYTFNHQLWFAAALGELGDSIIQKKSKKELQAFLAAINTFRTQPILPNSALRHPCFGYGLKSFFRMGKYQLARVKSKDYKFKEVGYHLFNVQAYSRLIKCGLLSPDTKIALEKNINQLVLSGNFLSDLQLSKYSFSYNPPGFELLATISNTQIDNPELIKLAEQLIQKQFDVTFNAELFSFSENNPDPITLDARVYELSQVSTDLLKNVLIKL